MALRSRAMYERSTPVETEEEDLEQEEEDDLDPQEEEGLNAAQTQRIRTIGSLRTTSQPSHKTYFSSGIVNMLRSSFQAVLLGMNVASRACTNQNCPIC